MLAWAALLPSEGADPVCCWRLKHSLHGSGGCLSLVFPVFRMSVRIYLHLEWSWG